uniref:Uncharacterized protein n=1 Tax=Cacopsylla melanoneura TaxID=428564 RepID=A0A8D8Z662_9HEMI
MTRAPAWTEWYLSFLHPTVLVWLSTPPSSLPPLLLSVLFWFRPPQNPHQKNSSSCLPSSHSCSVRCFLREVVLGSGVSWLSGGSVRVASVWSGVPLAKAF